MKYINFSTLKSGWKQNKVILLTGRLGYFLQNKKKYSKYYERYDL